MSKFTVIPAAPPEMKTDWFMLKSGKAIYRRGKDGLWISALGIRACDYSGAASKVFDNRDEYTPIYPGTKITFTI